MEARKTLTAALLAFSLALPFQTNHPPTVKIESPANHAVLDMNAPAAYQVHVTDQEDGDTRYDEINPKEVLLEVTQLKPGPKSGPEMPAEKMPAEKAPAEKMPPAKAPAAQMPPAIEDSALRIMATDNCFNCHQFNAKSLGPSFFEVAKRYPATAASTDTLINRVRNGSSGIWPGTEKMPAHPELTAAAIRSTVRWILRSAARPDHAWYFGTTGILHFSRPGTYILTATYTDHGTKDLPTPRLTGADRIIVTVK